MNRSTVWKIVKKFQQTENTLNRPECGRKRSVRSPHLFKNTREKLRRNLRRSCKTLAIAAVSKFTTSSCFAISTLLFPLLWSVITAFRSTVIVKLIFENFVIPSLKVEIASCQIVIILWKLTTLKGFYRKTQIGCLTSWTPSSFGRSRLQNYIRSLVFKFRETRLTADPQRSDRSLTTVWNAASIQPSCDRMANNRDLLKDVDFHT